MAGGRSTAAAIARGPVTISFAGYNRAWASWIASRLERHGVQAVLQRLDVTPETRIDDALEDLLLSEGRVLIVLSEWYFRLGPRTYEEWNAALRRIVPPHSERFAAVSVTPAALPSAVASLAATDLWGLGAAEAERRLLTRLGISHSRGSSGDTLGGAGGPRFPLEQPAVWGGMPRRNTRFTGREELLGEMHQQFQQAEPGAGVVTLFGLSGVGKTHIATEYVYRFGPEYDVVWWVRAAERGTLREKLAGLAPALGLVTGREYGERLRTVRDALRRGEPYGRWLVILDGADQPDDIHDLVPNGPGHVLITSQNRDWGEHNSVLIEVPVYDRVESVAFVRRRAPRLDEADADKLAEALGDLALALDQNAGALNDSNTPVDEYIELLRHGADIEPGLKVAADFQMTYYTAFSILLNRLREDKPEAVDLLRLCVFFAPGPIPVRLLRDLPIRDVPEQLGGLMGDPLLWNSAISKLAQWSVIQSDPQETTAEESVGSTEVVQMHRLVYQAVRADMPEEDLNTYSRVVRKILAAADPGRPTDTRLWPRYAEIVPHLASSGALESTNPEIQVMVLNCLRYLYLSGEYRAGLRVAEIATENWPHLLDAGHPRLWDLLHHHANLMRATGDYEATEALDRGAYEQLLADRGDRDLLVMRAGGNLAADLRNLGRYTEALDLSAAVRDGYAALVGIQDSRTLSAQNNIAVTYRLLGRYQEAMELDQNTLEARRELLRDRHNWTLSSEYAFAHDLRLVGRYDQATSVQERNCEVHRTVLGADNPQTLLAEHNLALCYHRGGDRPRAANLQARLLERCQRVLGDLDPLTVRVATTFSSFEREHGDLDRARELSEFALREYRRQLGQDHPYAAGVLGNHGLVLRAAGERQQSQIEIEGALVAMTRAVGAEHPWTLGCALNATGARNFSGDPESAAELSRQTAELAAATLGKKHPLTLSCQTALATDLRNLRRRPEADKIEEEALAALAGTLGPQHPHTVAARSRTRPYWDFEPFAS
ncbi:FxSxx-COOH system tetratricopeptide repeat protein [Streptomyces cocklensis]|uniref:Tetratricopeptide repeat-containing protein n=1 Tax=Actinacidiphila cocklensis TaxID=887465 RepID=A0A9W4DTN4_9ACTN|nr:FxSxx-COOH system tetratricopeptide repeat protein [Actinacidiphila cocklensis]MDD1061286.1 FxSxx-COOH system tetratricopeptide repeat protein [Actinacidiphila cocklensis]WSX76875.1 FxSxx-COOH system tetratricopeptide repeat protein [Streptomyces sp. NBC_00899]CAG6395848.1 Tetratricopeptide repeat-containing protein [Actinacidiphila cocklensis]